MMKDIYEVRKINTGKDIVVEVPGSKSITNRALMLAALSDGKCLLKGVLFSDDSRAFLDCLEKLGYDVKINETDKCVCVLGTNGDIPNKKAVINVRSAGTAARFLTVMLAFAGGEYIVESSEQMKKRPMAEIIEVLRNAGVSIECLEEEGHFPIKITSKGINTEEISINTDISSQYASALLMSAVTTGLKVKLTGKRVEGAYIKITLRLLEQFGICYEKSDNEYLIEKQNFQLENYQIEPDMSAACYFYAMAILLKKKAIVKNLHLDSMQGDIKFIYVLEKLGCHISDSELGIVVDGSLVERIDGIDIDMNDFSDQALTMAVVAAFAKNESRIRNIGHIRGQESDRVQVIVTELKRLGCCAEIVEENGQTDVVIRPGVLHGAEIETYNDHRVAMSFALAGLVVEGVVIKNPMCCKKTFENYFDVLDEITKINS